MKTRVFFASKHHAAAYAWYLSGFTPLHSEGVTRAPLRPFIYAPRQGAASGLQPVSLTLGTNWSFWRTGLAAPGVGLALLAFSFSLGLLESCLSSLVAVPRLLLLEGARALLGSPLLCLIAIHTAFALYGLRAKLRQTGARPWLGALSVLVLWGSALVGLAQRHTGRRAVTHPALSSTPYTHPWVVLSQDVMARTQSFRRAFCVDTVAAPCGHTPVYRGGLAPAAAANFASDLLLSLRLRPVLQRSGVPASASTSLAWPALSSQLVARTATLRVLASSWQFFLDAQGSRIPSFNVSFATKPQQWSEAVRLVARRAALTRSAAWSGTPHISTSPEVLLVPGAVSQPLTLCQRANSAGAAGLQLLQVEVFAFKGKPWTRA